MCCVLWLYFRTFKKGGECSNWVTICVLERTATFVFAFFSMRSDKSKGFQLYEMVWTLCAVSKYIFFVFVLVVFWWHLRVTGCVFTGWCVIEWEKKKLKNLVKSKRLWEPFRSDLTGPVSLSQKLLINHTEISGMSIWLFAQHSGGGELRRAKRWKGIWSRVFMCGHRCPYLALLRRLLWRLHKTVLTDRHLIASRKSERFDSEECYFWLWHWSIPNTQCARSRAHVIWSSVFGVEELTDLEGLQVFGSHFTQPPHAAVPIP